MKHLSILDEKHSFRCACRTHTMCNHDDRLSVLIDTGKEIKQCFGSPRVQRSCRFVREKELWFGNQRSGNCRTLFLSS